MAAMSAETVRRFVVVPAQNNFNTKGVTDSLKMSRTFSRLAVDPQSSGAFEGNDATAGLLDGSIRVVERIDREASIVELTEAQRLALTAVYPGLIVRPEVRLKMLRPSLLSARLKRARVPLHDVAKRLEIVVVNAAGEPVKGVDVVLIFSLKRNSGLDGLVTDDRGRVVSPLPARLGVVDLVTANPFSGYWPAAIKAVKIDDEGTTKATIELVAIEEGLRDSLDHVLDPLPAGSGAGVKIAVIDSGISAPPTARIVLGCNTTGAEDLALSDDNGSGH